MPRYVAFLRGVSPLNAKMPELKRSFEAAGFRNVRTVLASGNVVFDAPVSAERTLELRAESAMNASLGRSFHTIVRASSRLAELLAFDPYTSHGIPGDVKRVVSFLREARPPRVPLPLAQDHACVFLLVGREAFTAYVRTDKGPVFMQLIERAFGTDVTTRTLDTVARCAAA
ncbi:MAG TPA: DUF1697 domain-containing protein [Burkholderiaceae bacterium]|nr:DUF1697 domain-containing protein [Burkholderiaceae bacterium]